MQVSGIWLFLNIPIWLVGLLTCLCCTARHCHLMIDATMARWLRRRGLYKDFQEYVYKREVRKNVPRDLKPLKLKTFDDRSRRRPVIATDDSPVFIDSPPETPEESNVD